MESLSPECTPLKHRYDSCFNSWFEGYLQPALDASKTANTFQLEPSSTHSTTSSTVSSDLEASSSSSHDSLPRPRLVTSWADAFRPRPRAKVDKDPPIVSEDHQPARENISAMRDSLRPIEMAGKTRAQIKAEEYERACGESWQSYQVCLKKAIKANQSLSTLLEQARDEHPLHSQRGLEGSPWDPDAEIRSTD